MAPVPRYITSIHIILNKYIVAICIIRMGIAKTCGPLWLVWEGILLSTKIDPCRLTSEICIKKIPLCRTKCPFQQHPHTTHRSWWWWCCWVVLPPGDSVLPACLPSTHSPRIVTEITRTPKYMEMDEDGSFYVRYLVFALFIRLVCHHLVIVLSTKSFTRRSVLCCCNGEWVCGNTRWRQNK